MSDIQPEKPAEQASAEPAGNRADNPASDQKGALWRQLKEHKVAQWTLAYVALAYTLLHGAEMLSGALGWPHAWIRIFTLLLILSIPVVAVIAWYHGARGQRSVSATELMIIALLLALSGAFLWRDSTTSHGVESSSHGTAEKSAATQPAPPAASIAVLAFSDLSTDGTQAYFSDGMAEEILNALAHVQGLKVASRTSSFQYRGTARGAPAIAAELQVRHLLEGSVRKSGESIRVTAQLIDAASDTSLWSATFDRTLTAKNVFAIQDEIASAIVTALHNRIGGAVQSISPASPARTGNVKAYDLFLKARALFQSRRNLDQADRLLEEAVTIDPRFADAFAIRAAIQQIGGEYGMQFADERAARKTGRDFAAQALVIDPNNSTAIAATALSYLYDRQEGFGTEDIDLIFADFDRALRLDPGNANALNWQGLSYAFFGDNEHAAAVHRRCIEVDPGLAACRSNLAIELLALGKRSEAESVVDAAIDTGTFAAGPGQMIMLADLKRRDAFLVLSGNVPALKGFRKFGALYDALSESNGDHRAIAAELRALFAENHASRRVNALLNVLGDYSASLIIAMWAPAMNGYRRSTEFKQHMRASGVVDYWHKHGFPPQCKAIGTSDFECR